ncbi:unnamed protein product [Dimorphilus gyrociliatus]|uniref:Glycosyltransferase family 92 protein n=1 Tax=Dimorphilus gyrociliatus TaxID=2664684 RepID=A0A7I8VAF2_9ANNE|nr:unnamed protein product [Dimorphilus gyrociliatus]
MKKSLLICTYIVIGIGLYVLYNLLMIGKNEQNIVEFEKLEKLAFQDLINGEWQTLKKDSNIIYFHRAIYDSRKFEKWSSPCVTMFVLSNTQEVNDLEDLTCGYTFFNRTIRRNTNVILTDKAFRWHETHLQEFVVQCPVDGIYPIPTYIFIERNTNDRATLKIERPYAGSHDIGICVPVIYGSFDTHMLIEWFELHKFFGVNFFDITVWNVSSDVLSVLKYYESQQQLLLTLVDIPFKVKLDQTASGLQPSKKPFFLKAFMPIALNECYLMNSLRAKYMLSLDFDEFIYINMTKYRSYNQLLQNFHHDEYFVNLLMGKVKFDISCQMTLKSSSYIFRHAFRQPLETMKMADNPKSFFRPTNCPYMGNHFCVWNKEVSQKGYPRAKTSQVFVSHFRKREKCEESVKQKYQIDRTLKFAAPTLLERFAKVKNKLRLKKIT